MEKKMEKDGKCKEYENNNLIFEGEYRNGYKKKEKNIFMNLLIVVKIYF